MAASENVFKILLTEEQQFVTSLAAFNLSGGKKTMMFLFSCHTYSNVCIIYRFTWALMT